jgi:hypothetical protein
VNEVVPFDQLQATVRTWADDMLALSPTALRFLKQSFNADTDHIAGIASMSFSGLGLFAETDEAREACARSARIGRRSSASTARGRRSTPVQASTALRTESSRPGKRASRSWRRSEFSRVVPSTCWRITPASRRTRK